MCLEKLPQKKCPFDQNPISREIDELPVNFALLQLVGVAVPENAEATLAADSLAENFRFYNAAKRCIEELAIYLKPMPQSKFTMCITVSSDLHFSFHFPPYFQICFCIQHWALGP